MWTCIMFQREKINKTITMENKRQDAKWLKSMYVLFQASPEQRSDRREATLIQDHLDSTKQAG